MTLLLIRHGETALNAARTLQPADTPLSARGIAQAQALAQRLASHGLAGILSSDLPRALETAHHIARATGLPVHTTALLHERHFGTLRGQRYDDLGFDPLTSEEAPPGGESGAAFRQRVAEAFALALQRRATLPGPLAVVTHGLVIRAWLAGLVQRRPGDPAPVHVGNTSVSIVAAEPPHEALLINCTRHLDASSNDDAHALSGG